VALQPGDDAKGLAAAGIAAKRIGKRRALPQPCPAFDGCRCKVYELRPARCRAFECRLLQRTRAGGISKTAAVRLIRAAKRKVERVSALLDALGEREVDQPLNRRCANVMRRPLDLGGDAMELKRRAKLMAAMEALRRVLARDFLD
jgi:Fe-S-cluster containining protein